MIISYVICNCIKWTSYINKNLISVANGAYRRNEYSHFLMQIISAIIKQHSCQFTLADIHDIFAVRNHRVCQRQVFLHNIFGKIGYTAAFNTIYCNATSPQCQDGEWDMFTTQQNNVFSNVVLCTILQMFDESKLTKIYYDFVIIFFLHWKSKCDIIILVGKRHPGVAQFGSALEWGSRGRWFDSSHSDLNA